ncbi:MAG: hypothetical protein M1827_002071 [Pycnora praestabilis]|nr:MAG: hypothetical protein M1827_002071 [Pycnora praestabilis]
MALEEALVSDSEHANTLFQRLEEYPWHQDAEFQGGLAAILGSNPSFQQAQELTLRARCFYFSRKHDVPVDFDSYKAWRQSSIDSDVNGISPSSQQSPACSTTQSPGDTTQSSGPAAPYPTSFAQIVDLITTGQPIPGIQKIPDTILAGKETPSTTSKRRKPWEQVNGSVASGDTLSSTQKSEKADVATQPRS